MNRKVTIWRAILCGQCKQIGLNEEDVRDLRDNAWHTELNDKSWKFVSEKRYLPVVQGKWTVAQRWIVDLEKDVPDDLGPPYEQAPHIKWRCPYCKENHFTDIDLKDPSIALWFCENSRSDEMALVKWRRPKSPTTPRTLRRVPRRRG